MKIEPKIKLFLDMEQFYNVKSLSILQKEKMKIAEMFNSFWREYSKKFIRISF
jgi:hypothetical protein